MELAAGEMVDQPARRQRRRAISFLALLVAVFAGAWAGNRYFQFPQNAGLEVSANELDFGEVWATDRFPWTIHVRNLSSEPVVVARLATSCGCLQPEPSTFTVPPEGNVPVHLTLNLAARELEDAAGNHSDFGVTISPLVRGGLPNYAGWELKGQIRRFFRYSEPRVDFQDSLVLGKAFPTRVMTVSCSESVRSLEIRGTDADVTAHVKPLDTERKTFQVELRVNSQLGEGRFQRHLSVTAALASGIVIPGPRLTVQGRVVSDLQLIPEVVVLHADGDGARAQQTVLARCRSGRSVGSCQVEVPADSALTFEPASADDVPDSSYRIYRRRPTPKFSAETVRVVVQPTGSSERLSATLRVLVQPSSAVQSGLPSRGKLVNGS